MDCCAGCDKPKVDNVKFDVYIRFDMDEQIIPELIGKDVGYDNAWLLLPGGAMPKGGFHVQHGTYGERHHLNVYRRRLPFDELMSTIQFNSETGAVRVQNLALVEFEQVQVFLTRAKVTPKLYNQIAPQVYRVGSRAGFIQLFEKLALGSRDLAHAENQILNNGSKENWPMLAIINNQSPFVTTRNAPVIDIPDWKNDAVWQ